MAKKHNKGTAKLKRITSEAKKVYDKPGCKKKWTTVVKEVARKLKNK